MQDPHTIIAHLTPNDALAVLRVLAGDDAALAARIAEVAIANLSQIDVDQVAQGVQKGLDALDIEEAWDIAGANRFGYTEPQEAVCEMIERVVEPVSQEMTKYVRLGMPVQAKQVCMGLLLGLYRFEHESTGDFQENAIDELPEYADWILDQWKSGTPSATDLEEIQEFIAVCLTNGTRLA